MFFLITLCASVVDTDITPTPLLVALCKIIKNYLNFSTKWYITLLNFA